MSVKRTTIGRRLACAVGASALILSGAGFAGPAVAQTEPTASVAPADYGNIDFAKQGHITINKHLHQNGSSAVGDPATGDYDGTPAEGLDGVTFEIYKIKDIDLSKQAGWEAVNKYKIPADPANDSKLELVDTVTTANGGKATTKDLPVAAYVVVEADAPADVIDRSAPFVVTLPYPDTTANDGRLDERTNTWLYDVNVFPKNGKTKLNKTVEMQNTYGLNVGSEVHFPVTAEIPQVAKDNVFKYFQVVDPMDSRFDQESLGVESVTLGGTALESGDYTVATNGSRVIVSLTSQGLGKLKNAAGQELKVVFKGKLKSLDNGKKEDFGRILNQAYVYSDTEPNPGESTPPSTPPTEPVTTPPDTPPVTTTPPGGTPLVKQFWGDLKIHKVDQGDGKTGLQGAKFKIYPATNAYPENGTCGPEYDKDAPVQVNGTGTGNDLEVTSDKDGNVHFEGLFVSDDQNDPKSAKQRCYVLVETEAPTGFVTPKDEAAVFPVAVKIGQTAAEEYDAKVENVKRDTPELPLTGGKGVLFLMIVGGLLLLVAVGAGFAFVRRINK